MSVKTLQNEIIENDGVILSDGTLNLEHLLPKAYNVIVVHGLSADKTVKDVYGYDADQLAKDILKVFTPKPVNSRSLAEQVYYGLTKIKEKDLEEADYLWNERVFNLFNNIVPEGYYFGSNEGDGACIGWFKYEEEVEEYEA